MYLLNAHPVYREVGVSTQFLFVPSPLAIVLDAGPDGGLDVPLTPRRRRLDEDQVGST